LDQIALIEIGMSVLAVVIIPMLITAFKTASRLDRSDGKHELTDQRLNYVEADGRRQDQQLTDMAATLREVRDATLRIEAGMKH
jgi:hypothetical protein